VEADLHRIYGVDLVGLWSGQLTLRKLRVLIEQLPPDCATAYALAGAELGQLSGWRLTDLLLGRLADELALYRWQWEAAHIDPKKTRHRAQPPSVLPELEPSSSQPDSIPVVSPHRLGDFVSEQEDPRGY